MVVFCLTRFLDGFVDVPVLNFIGVLKDGKNLRISALPATEHGVSPLLFGALG